MPDYIVTENGIYRNGTGGYQRVAEMHCTLAEAREIAADLGVALWTEREMRSGQSSPLAHRPSCADPFCDHIIDVEVERVTGKRHLSV